MGRIWNWMLFRAPKPFQNSLNLKNIQGMRWEFLVWHFLLALVSIRWSKYEWEGVRLRWFFAILVSQWKILCWLLWRDAQDPIFPQEQSWKMLCSRESGTNLKAQSNSETCWVAQEGSSESRAGGQKVKLNSPKVLLHFCRSDLNTGQTKKNILNIY